MVVLVQPLTKEFFRPYGEVVVLHEAALCSTSQVHDYWDGVAHFNAEGPQVCSLFGIKKSIGQPIGEMERHLETEEVLIALRGDVVITLANPDDKKLSPDAKTIQSFYMRQGEGVVMKKGVWHALPCAKDGDAMLLVIFKENTSYTADPLGKTDIYFCPLDNFVEVSI